MTAFVHRVSILQDRNRYLYPLPFLSCKASCINRFFFNEQFNNELINYELFINFSSNFSSNHTLPKKTVHVKFYDRFCCNKIKNVIERTKAKYVGGSGQDEVKQVSSLREQNNNKYINLIFTTFWFFRNSIYAF